MNADELIGLTVRVHPMLQHDPAGRYGQLGNITQADRIHDDYLVRFDDGLRAHYSADALLVLQPFEKLYELIENRDADMPSDTYKDLLSIALLQRYGSAKQIRTAFDLVQQHEHLKTYAILGLNEVLGEHLRYRSGR